MATELEIRKMLKLLRRNFTEWNKGCSEDEIEESYRLYIDRLKDLPIELLQQAVLQHVDQGQYFPKIAELRQPVLTFLGKQREQLEAQRQRAYIEERDRQEAQRYFSREESAHLMRELYEKLARQRDAEKQAKRHESHVHAQKQKSLAKKILADEE